MGRLTKPLSTLLEDLLVSAKTGLDHKKSSIFVAEKNRLPATNRKKE